ncbi:MAG: hypothetical protein NVS1B4_02740 [Gemmatimonadaceae bacterium]
MFDSEYFRNALQADVDAVGGSAVVEVHLLNAQSYRLRSVLAVHNGYVSLEAYQDRSDVERRPRWKEPVRDGINPHETERVVMAYDGIANVIITPSRPAAAAAGFGG